MEEFINCFACGAKTLNVPGESHPYMLSSPGCWIMYGEVLEREYSDVRYSRAHHFTVDAFAIQHPGNQSDIRAVNSVNIHLASLYMIFERGLNVSEAAVFKNNYAQHHKGNDIFEWLHPPESSSELTIFDIWNNEKPELHAGLSEKWARSVWHQWAPHHKHVEQLVNRFLAT